MKENRQDKMLEIIRNYDVGTQEELAGRLRDILHAVDPGWPWYNKEEDKNEFPDIWWASLERILGRTVTEDELGDVIWDTEQWKSFYDDDWL